MRRRSAGVFLVFLLLIQNLSAAGSSAESPRAGDPLLQAQIENQKAQARYYSRQSDARGFWRSLRDFGWPIGVILVGAAAIAAVGLSQRANLRSRADTEFYEMIKLFSQSENTSTRLMAAGVLAQMAVRWNRFYECAFDQLSLALLSEPQNRIRDAIQFAVGRLVKRNPEKSLQKLEAMNRILKSSLYESLCQFFGTRGAEALISAGNWARAEKLTGFDRPTLQGLLEDAARNNPGRSVVSGHQVGNDFDGEAADRPGWPRELEQAAEQLRSNVRLIAESLSQMDPESAGFGGRLFSGEKNAPNSLSSTFLAGGEFRNLESCRICRVVLRNANMASANLERASLLEVDLSNSDLSYANLSFVECKNTNLTGAILRHADLRGARIKNTELSGADLSDAIFQDTSIVPTALQNTDWWKADFRHQRNLLKAVYANFKKDLPDLEHLYVRGEIHQSVLDFIGKVTEDRL